ncbi:Mitochondrial glycoprotein [Macleaya cordata]|uniref:Mitochondrial glycoprotein n=1 Tax=Macleaya cordata TaxID=56857 RepID=A0A200QYU1_MACCD|nr:Mitochondrial glycoprotein [Macleaya cordata]
MAFSTIIRRAASSIVPLANRAIGAQRSFSSAIFSTLLKKNSSGSLTQELCRRTFVPTLHFSSLSKKPSSDETLIQVIDSEIQCAEETDDHDRVEEIPSWFPFKIEDNPGEQTITLTREYHGEVIKVIVHMPDLVTGDGEDDDQDNDDDGEKGGQSSIPLVVSISKKSGPCLEFSVLAYPDEITINSMSVKEPEASEDEIAYEGPDFSDLDDNLQKAFHKYLEIRGIKPSTTNFLHEYMINKDSKEYLTWLNNLKKFIAS